MVKVAKFYKVSFEQFYETFKNDPKFSLEDIRIMYENIKLPQRATVGSAGYDFYTPIEICLKPKQQISIPTGIRCEMSQDCVLMIYPRSGLGFKYRLQLNNTVGIIDSDYFYSDNEGHIFIKITNDSNEDKEVKIEKNQAFAQGIFTRYLLVDDDDTKAKRNGGFGSTDK